MALDTKVLEIVVRLDKHSDVLGRAYLDERRRTQIIYANGFKIALDTKVLENLVRLDKHSDVLGRA